MRGQVDELDVLLSLTCLRLEVAEVVEELPEELVREVDIFTCPGATMPNLMHDLHTSASAKNASSDSRKMAVATGAKMSPHLHCLHME